MSQLWAGVGDAGEKLIAETGIVGEVEMSQAGADALEKFFYRFLRESATW